MGHAYRHHAARLPCFRADLALTCLALRSEFRVADNAGRSKTTRRSSQSRTPSMAAALHPNGRLARKSRYGRTRTQHRASHRLGKAALERARRKEAISSRRSPTYQLPKDSQGVTVATPA